MNGSYAKRYLMKALAMEIKRDDEVQKKIESRVRSRTCILDGCNNPLVARGLCDKHRQYFRLRKAEKSSDEERLEFEEKAITKGLILADDEQRQICRDNPFASAG